MSNGVLRILIVDDEQTIRDEFRNVLSAKRQNSGLDALESKLFGTDADCGDAPAYDLEFASQGNKAVEIVRQSLAQKDPFALIFLDMRMPPGPDGLWTAQNIRAIDPNVHFVIVTAYTDVDVSEIQRTVRPIEKLLYVQKPFYPQEIRQFAAALTQKWLVERQLEQRSTQLARVIKQVLHSNKVRNG
jgi:CheY-like chemotaxis protein